MTILVTGAAGFIGSNIISKLLDKEDRVIGIDNFNDYYDPKIKRHNITGFLNRKNFFLEPGDIENFGFLESVFSKYKMDRVIHLAARAGVRASILNPEIYFRTNVLGTLNLLKLACGCEIDHFVVTSSSSVYGFDSRIPFAETAFCGNPMSPYAVSKRSMEMLAGTYHRLYGLPVSIIRPFTVYGPAGRPDMAPFLFTKAIYEGRTFQIFGDGKASRDFTYIDDFTDGLIKIFYKPRKYMVYNIGFSRPRTVIELVGIIEKNLNRKARIEYMDPQREDMPVTYADISTAQKIIKYNPQIELEEGMERFINWFIRNHHIYK